MSTLENHSPRLCDTRRSIKRWNLISRYVEAFVRVYKWTRLAQNFGRILHDMGLIEHAGLDVDIADREEFNLKVKKRFDHVTKQFAVASQNCSNGILCIGNGNVEEQHEMNMLYLWKNLCFTYTDDATGTNSSWLPPHLSAPALAAPSWFLAKNSCATNNASYRGEWTRNHLLESLAYFSVASLGSLKKTPPSVENRRFARCSNTAWEKIQPRGEKQKRRMEKPLHRGRERTCLRSTKRSSKQSSEIHQLRAHSMPFHASLLVVRVISRKIYTRSHPISICQTP